MSCFDCPTWLCMRLLRVVHNLSRLVVTCGRPTLHMVQEWSTKLSSLILAVPHYHAIKGHIPYRLSSTICVTIGTSPLMTTGWPKKVRTLTDLENVSVNFCMISVNWKLASIKLASYLFYKCKKLWFIHELTANDTSKTAKITKRWLPTSTSPKCQCAVE